MLNAKICSDGYKRFRQSIELNKPLVISSIHSGLGNQMFQYAHALSVAKNLDSKLKLDLSWFLYEGDQKGKPFQLSLFEGFRYTQATKSELDFRYSRMGRAWGRWNRFLMRNQRRPIYRLYLDGYYAGERFFKDSSASVRRSFKFPPLQTEAGRRAEALIRAEPASVALHVRHGDYLCLSKFEILTRNSYYAEAMEFVESRAPNPRYFVFSDDIPFCKTFFQGKDVHFVEGCASEVEEMHLMSLCDHSIIANSTFSWWGAWLGVDKKLVVAPHRWFNNEKRNKQMKRNGVYPDAWHAL